MKKLLLIITAIFLFSGCSQKQTISVTNTEVEIPGIIESKKDSEFVYTLFSMKKTSLSNLEDIRTIIKTTPYFSEKQFELTNEGSTLNISYNTKLRSVYRQQKELEKSLMQTSLTIFALASDVEKTVITLTDVYGEYLVCSYDRNTVNECYGASYFTLENINNSTEKRERFESYLLKILEIKCEENQFDVYFEEISKKLSDEEIIEFESAEKFEVFFKEELEITGFDINEYAKANKINMEKYIGSKLNFIVLDINNFISNKTESYLYVFKNESIIVINSRIENRNLLIEQLKRWHNATFFS